MTVSSKLNVLATLPFVVMPPPHSAQFGNALDVAAEHEGTSPMHLAEALWEETQVTRETRGARAGSAQAVTSMATPMAAPSGAASAAASATAGMSWVRLWLCKAAVGAC